VILDETNLVNDKREIGDFLFQVVTGPGRGRGSLSGTQATGTWRTVLLSSGEGPAASYSSAGGTKSRTVTVWGIPFDTDGNATATLVKQVNTRIKQHYGHAGPRFVRHLLKHKEASIIVSPAEQAFPCGSPLQEAVFAIT
jgi:uncharacterized protein (DUF927 family)